MASGTINLAQSSSSGAYIVGKIEWSSTPNLSGNYSNVTAKLYVRKDNTDMVLTKPTYGTWPYTISINGDSTSGNSESNTQVLLDWVLIATKTVKVTHDSDGSKSIVISGSVMAPAGTSYDGHKTSGSKSVSLDTIARASAPTVDKASVAMGGSVTITTNRKSDSFTHTLTYSFGGQTGTIATGVGASYNWTVPDLVSVIPNNGSGICTITCKTYNWSQLVGENATQITLIVPGATVPSLSASSVEMENAITISLPKKSSVYTHSLTYSLTANGESTELLAGSIADGVGVSYEWSVPLSFAAYIPSYPEATVTVICKTFNGTYLVGTQSASFTATVPDNSKTKPKVTMSVSVSHDLPSAFDGVCVVGKSKIIVRYTASSEYSNIKSYLTKLLTYRSSNNPYISPVINRVGTLSVTGEVVDTRGYSTENTQSFTAHDYNRPRIIPWTGNSIVCTRCNSNGNTDPGGSYLLLKLGRKYSKIVANGSQRNYCKLSYQWKKDEQDDSGYSEPVEILSKTATSDYVSEVISGVVTSNTTAYTIRLIAEDDVGETDVVTCVVPTAFVTAHVPVGGHGITFGGYHNASKVDVFECWFDTEFHGSVSGLFEHGEANGWYWRKYADGIAECWQRVNYTNKSITNVSEKMYYTNCDSIRFPITFSSAPTVTATIEGGDMLMLMSWRGTTGNATTTTTNTASYRVASQSIVTNTSFTISYHAIGRWKQ
jgi:hypothetical protein